MGTGDMEYRGRTAGDKARSLLYAGSRAASLWIVSVLCLAVAATDSFPAELETAVTGLERRYASAVTMTGSFRQTYRAPGIQQVESGVFRMKRPGLMRWEYRNPEEKLFIADGREAFLYVPLDGRSRSSLSAPPICAERRWNFCWEARTSGKLLPFPGRTSYKPSQEQAMLIRLTPRSSQSQYEFLVLALDPKQYDLRRITIHELAGTLRNLCCRI